MVALIVSVKYVKVPHRTRDSALRFVTKGYLDSLTSFILARGGHGVCEYFSIPPVY